MTGFIFIGMLFFLFLTGFLVLISFRGGKTAERAGKEEEINAAVKKALAVHDRLQHDADYAKRVRQRFTR